MAIDKKSYLIYLNKLLSQIDVYIFFHAYNSLSCRDTCLYLSGLTSKGEDKTFATFSDTFYNNEPVSATNLSKKLRVSSLTNGIVKVV